MYPFFGPRLRRRLPKASAGWADPRHKLPACSPTLQHWPITRRTPPKRPAAMPPPSAVCRSGSTRPFPAPNDWATTGDGNDWGQAMRVVNPAIRSASRRCALRGSVRANPTAHRMHGAIVQALWHPFRVRSARSGIRGCRFAQPPATFWHPDWDAAGGARRPDVRRGDGAMLLRAAAVGASAGRVPQALGAPGGRVKGLTRTCRGHDRRLRSVIPPGCGRQASLTTLLQILSILLKMLAGTPGSAITPAIPPPLCAMCLCESNSRLTARC